MFLNCHSYHSLRYGTLSIEQIVEEAYGLGISTLVLTDLNTITGIYDFHKACEARGIKPLAGVEVREKDELYYITIAKRFEGLAEVNELLTRHHCEGEILSPWAPEFKDLFVVYPLEHFPETLRPNEFIGVRACEINLLLRPDLRPFLERMVVLHPVTLKTKKHYNLHRILRAIEHNCLLSKLAPTQICDPSERFIAPQELETLFSRYPQIIENTKGLLKDATFEFEFSIPRNKMFYTRSREDDQKLLTRLAHLGLKRRYGENHPDAQVRVKRELSVIKTLNFSGYFLITWDIIRYSNRMGFMHVGRGSGANSIVAYCLGITDICPIELNLYFERFLNENRKSPPDFDIDWSWQDRDTILTYIFERYGKNHVAFCGTNVEFKYRSIFREVGKVFGLPKDDLDQLAKNPIRTHEQSAVVSTVQKYGMLLEKFPNQRSMHSCGIIISQEPLTVYTALEMPPKGFPIIQFDMHVAEEIGFEKFDILSQRGLGTIQDTVHLVEKNRGVVLDIKDTRLSKNTPETNAYLSLGKTIGCFYIESPAMRGLLRRLKCDNYQTLVAASSIIRPGVAQSGMMREYIFRHNHPDRFEYFHKVFEEQLGDTYGIMVYQEDVIKIALHFGGLSAADGDILRRAMSGKGRSLSALQKVKDHFFESCRARGHSEQLSEEVYRQIESFAGYSFCKAHSASYAVESYQSLYLKVHYPIEFMVCAINNQGGFYRTEVYVHECRMAGAHIHNPCVNKSLYETTLYRDQVYLGFMHLQKLEIKLAKLLIAERESRGDYLSLEDFVRRIPVGIETLQILIFIGAFRFTGKAKNELLIEARLLLIHFKPEYRAPSLLEEPMEPYTLPSLERTDFEDAFDEIELLDFPVSCSPFDLLQTSYRGKVKARDLLNHHKSEVKMLAYLISRKHVPTKKGTMYFGTWIDSNGDYFDTAHFADSLRRYPFLGGGVYLLLGQVEVDFHFPTLTITKMAKMPFIPDPRYAYDKEKARQTEKQLKEDVSPTWRKPYPSEKEIGLPRTRMKIE